MSSRKLIVVGAGGHGRSVAEAAILGGIWSAIDFIDDAYPTRVSCRHWAVVGATRRLEELISPGDGLIIAIGDQLARKRLFNLAKEAGAVMTTVIHPRATISQYADIGPGTAVMAGAIVGAEVKIGMGTIVNANATVDHDAVLGDFVHLGVGVQLAGGVVVGDGAWLQAGVCAGYHVRVPPHTVIEPGTALVAGKA